MVVDLFNVFTDSNVVAGAQGTDDDKKLRKLEMTREGFFGLTSVVAAPGVGEE